MGQTLSFTHRQARNVRIDAKILLNLDLIQVDILDIGTEFIDINYN